MTLQLAEAAHVAWKSGQVELAGSLIEQTVLASDERVTRAALARLRGLVQLYSGDQGAAQENLMFAADAIAEREPSRAAGLFFMAVDAAYHRNRIDDAAACARRVRDLDCDPGYHRWADWLAASVADELDDPAADPWRVLDSAPPEDNAHRWLLPMAISRHGRYPRAAVEFGVVACERLRANGLLSMHTVLLPWLAELEHRLGKWPSARAYAEEGLRAATETGLHATATDAHSLIAHLAGLAGDGERCREHAEKALRLAAVAHNNLAAARANWALGSLHLARGEFEQAAERLHRLQHEHIAHYAVADTVEALVRTGALEDALQIVEEFRRTLNPSNPDLSRALLHRCCALLPGNDADKYYRLSLSTPDSELRPFEQARTALRYGQWLRRQRRINEGKGRLRNALQVFEGLGAVDWAATARGELRAAGVSSGPSESLTAQELQVAELAAAGLSNREIGARLFLSPRTVGYHLYKVFPKLGIAARAQLRDLRTMSSTESP